MPDDFVSIDVQGIPELQEKLRLLGPQGAQQIANDESIYFLRVVQQSEPTNKYVTRKAAYGQTFQSERQRRWFFRALHTGLIHVPYHRTGAMQAGWRIENQGTLNPVLVNRVPGAGWVFGTKQAMQLLMVGWRQLQKTVDGERRRIQQIADIAVRKVLRRLNL